MRIAEGVWRIEKMVGQVMEAGVMEVVKVVWGWQMMVVQMVAREMAG